MKFLQTPIGPVDHIDLLTVRLPFIQPFAISSYAWSCKEALLLRVEADGLTGWGECVADPDPFYARRPRNLPIHHREISAPARAG